MQGQCSMHWLTWKKYKSIQNDTNTEIITWANKHKEDVHLKSFSFSFFRCFGPKCGGCGEKIHYQDFVRKARDKVYHLRCFTCSLCSKQLSTGEVLYLQPGEEGFVCKDHYLNKGKTKSKATYISDNTSLHRNSPSVFSMIAALSWMSLKFRYSQKAQKMK